MPKLPTILGSRASKGHGQIVVGEPALSRGRPMTVVSQAATFGA